MLITSIGFGFDTEKLTKDLVRFRDICFKETTPRKPDQQLTIPGNTQTNEPDPLWLKTLKGDRYILGYSIIMGND